MSMTLYEAAKKSRNPLAAGTMLAIATVDELLSQMPMVPKSGESFMYTREKALPTVEFVAPDHGSLTESSPTFDRVMVPLRLVVSDVDTYLFAEEQMGENESIRPLAITGKLKALGRTLGEKCITGAYATSATISEATTSPGLAIDAVTVGPNQDSDRHGPGSIKYTHAGTLWQYRAPGDRTHGATVAAAADGTITLKSDNPSKWIQITLDVSDATADGEVHIRFVSTSNEFDGLQKLTPDTQVISATGADGDTLSFDKLDQMVDELVKVREKRFFVMNGKLKRKFYALVRALGGTDPTHIAVPGITNPVPTYRGIPILQSDWIGSAESKGAASTLSSAYLVALPGEQGFYFGVRSGSDGLSVSLDPRDTRVMGVRIREVGELEGKEAVRARLSFYGATALGSELAVARAKNLVTA